MSNSLGNQRRFRTVNVLDDYNRGRLGIEVDFSLPSGPVICTLKQIIEWRGKSLALRCDNGPNHISQNLIAEPLTSKSRCGAFNQVNQHKTPTSNDLIEHVRHEWLDLHSFSSIEHAYLLLAQWLWTYNKK